MLLYLQNQHLLISFLSGTHEEVKAGSSAVNKLLLNLQLQVHVMALSPRSDVSVVIRSR